MSAISSILPDDIFSEHELMNSKDNPRNMAQEEHSHNSEHVWERAPGPKVPVKNMKSILLKDVSQLTEHQGCV